jgi:hypothetical protein
MARGISTRWTVSRCFDPRGLMAGKLEQQSAQSKRRAISGVMQARHVHTLLAISPQWCCGVVCGHVGAG